MKVLVTGDRAWTDYKTIERELKKLPPLSIVIHGGCRGADSLAGLAARRLHLHVRLYAAKWTEQGLAGGPIRNALMLKQEHPDEQGVFIDKVLAFHDDISNSRGTKDMITKATDAGLTIELFTSSGVTHGR